MEIWKYLFNMKFHHYSLSSSNFILTSYYFFAAMPPTKREREGEGEGREGGRERGSSFVVLFKGSKEFIKFQFIASICSFGPLLILCTQIIYVFLSNQCSLWHTLHYEGVLKVSNFEVNVNCVEYRTL